jgi:glycoside/pentoside/hexuronide:cation symporter, GPH family
VRTRASRLDPAEGGATARSTATSVAGARLPRWLPVVYGAGAGGSIIVERTVATWLYFFWVRDAAAGEPAYVAPLVVGALLLGGRVVDAVTDPVVARWSDHHRGRGGRRRTFLAWSGLPLVLVGAALFFPPVDGPSPLNAIHLGVGLAAFYLVLTLYLTPHLALLADLSTTTRDRVDLATSKAIFSVLGSAAATIVAALLVGAIGFPGMLATLGGVALVLVYLPTTIDEHRFARPSAGPATTSPLLAEVRATLGNRPFRTVLVGANALWFGFNLVVINGLLYITVLLGLPAEALAAYMGVVLGVALLLLPVVNAAVRRLGLRRVMIGSMVATGVVYPLLHLLPTPPFGWDPPTFGLVVFGLAGIGLAGLFVVPDAIIAAVADHDQRTTGRRRAAMFYGVNGFVAKVNFGVSTAVSAVLLQTLGSPVGIQITGPVGALAAIVGAWLFLRYPEDEVQGTPPGPEAANGGVGRAHRTSSSSTRAARSSSTGDPRPSPSAPTG